jgi:hypothetical protein
MSMFPGQDMRGLYPGQQMPQFQMPVHYAPQQGGLRQPLQDRDPRLGGHMGGYGGGAPRSPAEVQQAGQGVGGLLSRYSQSAGGVQPVAAQPQSQAQQQMNIQKQHRQPYSQMGGGQMGGGPQSPWGQQQMPFGGGFMSPFMQQRSPWGGMGGFSPYGGGFSPFGGGFGGFGGGMNRRFGGMMGGGMMGGGMSPYGGGFNPFSGFNFGRMY